MKMKPNSNIERFKFFVRTKYAWPGGYPMYMLCADGGCLCHKCAGENAKLIIQATVLRDNHMWECEAIDVNWEDADLTCDNCGELIECAYGEDLPDEVVTAPQEPLNLVQFVGDFFQMPRSSK